MVGGQQAGEGAALEQRNPNDRRQPGTAFGRGRLGRMQRELDVDR